MPEFDPVITAVFPPRVMARASCRPFCLHAGYILHCKRKQPGQENPAPNARARRAGRVETCKTLQLLDFPPRLKPFAEALVT
jgi:hypothetical protein